MDKNEEFERWIAEKYGLDNLESAMTGAYNYKHMSKAYLAGFSAGQKAHKAICKKAKAKGEIDE